MPRHLRRRFFYVLIVAFIVFCATAVFYAQGWRVGFHPFEFARVGGIYIRTSPADAAVTLNDKPQDRNFGLFDKTTLISDLLPGSYKLTISAAGFQTWHRDVPVFSSMVARLEFITLVPVQAVAATTTPVFEMATAGNSLILRTATGLQTLEGASIARDRFLGASSDGAVVLSYATTSRSFFATDLSQSTSTLMHSLAPKTTDPSVASFKAVPGAGGLFLIQNQAALSLLRTAPEELVQLASSSIASAVAPGRAAWAEFDPKAHVSMISFYDPGSRAFGHNVDSVPGHVISLVLRDAGELFALADDGSVYALNLDQSSRIRLTQGARNLALSPDGNQLAVIDSQGLRILFLRSEQPQVAFTLPDAARIRGLLWYRDGEHLFVEYPDRLTFMELDDPLLQNFVSVASTGSAEYRPETNTVYFLADNYLFESVFPTP